jgi:hypothetical protein
LKIDGKYQYYVQRAGFCTSNDCNAQNGTYFSICDAASFKSVLNVIYAFAAAFASLGMCCGC